MLQARRTLGLRPAPEFEQWLHAIGMVDDDGRLTPFDVTSSPLRALTVSGAR
ncbi:Probable ethanolamine ammonia-lyase, heavy subunit [Mycobacteroides abscessus subsp. abscessus]|nr:Probable ethanolamine ammonia-lyase, heavy subunit [Mycobacteroides abscessus subsp. abscessus]